MKNTTKMALLAAFTMLTCFAKAVPMVINVGMGQNHTLYSAINNTYGIYVPPGKDLTLAPHLYVTRGLKADGTYEAVNMEIHLVASTAVDAIETDLMPARYLTTDAFEGTDIAYPTYLASIFGGVGSGSLTPPPYLIRVKYYYTDPATGVRNGPFYSSVTYSSNNYVNALQMTSEEGKLTRYTGNGKIYIRMDGVMRHIQTQATMNGVWKAGVSYTDIITDWDRAIIGAPFTPSTWIIRFMPSQRCYLKEGNVIRHIADPATADFYQLKLAGAQEVTTLAGLTEEPELQTWPWL
ncbi:hypothetical protein [Filimonas lacunae]|nr:hypothetical protein [Filimonas lacunae]